MVKAEVPTEWQRHFHARERVIDEWKEAGMARRKVRKLFGEGVRERIKHLAVYFKDQDCPTISDIPENRFSYEDLEYIAGYQVYVLIGLPGILDRLYLSERNRIKKATRGYLL